VSPIHWILNNQKKQDVDEVYDLYDYLNEKRAALEKWANYLAEIRARQVADGVRNALANLASPRKSRLPSRSRCTSRQMANKGRVK